jgi:hypothetical protein
LGVFSRRPIDLEAKHALLLAGAGWGNEPSVRADMVAGPFIRLQLSASTILATIQQAYDVARRI